MVLSVQLVHMMNMAQHQVATDLWTKPTGFSHKPASGLFSIGLWPI